MRETIGEWKKEWFETNGSTDEIEVVIEDLSQGDGVPHFYEGSFKDVPEELEKEKVISSGRILDSSSPERIGAYVLTINRNLVQNAFESEIDRIITAMMEHICDNICRHPYSCSEEELEAICCECKMGKFVCELLNLNMTTQPQNQICRYSPPENPATCKGCEKGCLDKKPAAYVNREFENAVNEMIENM